MYEQIRSPIRKSSIFVFKARIELFELKIIVFETRVDTGVDDKIELEGH